MAWRLGAVAADPSLIPSIHMEAHNERSVTPVPGDPMSSSGPCGPSLQAHGVFTSMHTNTHTQTVQRNV